jgi:hypothetical protein
MAWAEEQDWFGLEEIVIDDFQPKVKSIELPAIVWKLMDELEKKKMGAKLRSLGYKQIILSEEDD